MSDSVCSTTISLHGYKEEEEKEDPIQREKEKGTRKKGYRVSFVSPMYFEERERARENA